MNSHEFKVGELAWHTGMRVLVKIAGPLETLKQYHDMQGNVVHDTVMVHRVLVRGKAWLSKPHSLRRVGPFFASNWNEIQREFGWKPAGLRL